MTAARHLLAEALLLPVQERARLAEQVLESLEPLAGARQPQEWAEALRERVLAVKEGRAELLDGEQVLKEIEAELEAMGA